MNCKEFNKDSGCGKCSLSLNDPKLYNDLSAFNLIKIINTTFVDKLDKLEVLPDKTIVKCNRKVSPAYSDNISFIRVFSANKISIKEMLEKWYSANGTIYHQYSGCIQERIVGLIYIIDLIQDFNTLRHLLECLLREISYQSPDDPDFIY